MKAANLNVQSEAEVDLTLRQLQKKFKHQCTCQICSQNVPFFGIKKELTMTPVHVTIPHRSLVERVFGGLKWLFRNLLVN